MRAIGQIHEAKQAYLFIRFLSNQNIEATAEKQVDKGKEKPVFVLWVAHEDDVEKAASHLAAFQADPNQPQFTDLAEKQPPKAEFIKPSFQESKKGFLVKKRPSYPLTKVVILVCIVLFGITFYQSQKASSLRLPSELYAAVPILRVLSYDFPEKQAVEQKFFQENGITSPDEVAKLPEKQQQRYQQINQIPTWNGLYSLLLQWPKSKKGLKAKLFYQISRGELWRFFTPIFLHGGLLHLFFNMLWLWVLGKQLEERLKTWQYLAMMAVIALFSNTAQYLMSGPLFLGYSGVLCGMVGFIWMRQRIAPWEGYPLHPMTVAFLAIFVLGLLALQLVSFFLALIGKAPFSLGMIANSAHIVGAVCGLILGRIRVFSQNAT